MEKQVKVATLAELQDTFPKMQSVILTDFRGLTVSQVSGVRREIRKNACVYRVVKNTLAVRAIRGTKMEGLSPFFTGPTAIAYSFNDPVAPAKVLDKFVDDLANLKVKAGYVDGQVITPAGVKSLAKMKGKDELRAEFLMTLMAPAQNFVALIAAAPINFLLLLQARERSMTQS